MIAVSSIEVDRCMNLHEIFDNLFNSGFQFVWHIFLLLHLSACNFSCLGIYNHLPAVFLSYSNNFLSKIFNSSHCT